MDTAMKLKEHFPLDNQGEYQCDMSNISGEISF